MIWGFQDAQDLPTEAGADATAMEGGGGSPETGATRSDDTSTDRADVGDDASGASADGDAGSDARETGESGAVPDAGDADDASDTFDAPAMAPEAAPPCQTTCVARPPAGSGWQGPLAIHEGTSGAPPACPSDYAVDVYDGFGILGAGSTQCSCSCGAPSATCGSPLIQFFSDSNCTTSCSPASQALGASCTTLNVSTCGGLHYTIEAGAPSGTCPPDASVAVPAPSWGATVRLCGLPAATPLGDGCNTGEVCVPSAGYPFGEPGTLCVVSTGVASSCPEGYPVWHGPGRVLDPSAGPYYQSYTDTRGCTPCTCAPVQGVTCTYSVQTYGSTNCSAGSSQVSAPTGCTGAIKSALVTAATGTGGGCEAEGGAPTGLLMPTEPATVCCTR